jgi:hypothetical protein
LSFSSKGDVNVSSRTFQELRGTKTLIIGDVGSGKTQLTRIFLMEAIEEGYTDEITVIEMAPHKRTVKGTRVGGVLLETYPANLRYLEGDEIKTPRLSARNGRELLELADHNRHEIEKLLQAFLRRPTKILFINDVSIYLHRGDLGYLWSTIEKAETAVVNGYKGATLRADFDTQLSQREEQLMEALAAQMGVIIHLP